MREKTDKAQTAQETAQEAEPVGAKPLRYVDPNYTIIGVPARDLSAEEAARYAARINDAQAASRLVIYEEVA